jgi:hypothetical protein
MPGKSGCWKSGHWFLVAKFSSATRFGKAQNPYESRPQSTRRLVLNHTSYLSVVSVMIASFVSIMIVVVAVSMVIRVVIVFNTAVVSIPVACIITLAVVMWRNPVRSLVRRSSPIASVPFVMIAQWIPVAFYPHARRFWPRRDNDSHARRRWRPNHDANETCALLAFATTNSIAISSTALMKFFIRCVSSSLLTSPIVRTKRIRDTRYSDT